MWFMNRPHGSRRRRESSGKERKLLRPPRTDGATMPDADLKAGQDANPTDARAADHEEGARRARARDDGGALVRVCAGEDRAGARGVEAARKAASFASG